MPTYDYQCTDCGSHYEAFRKIADRATSDCPHCGGLGAQQVSAPQVKLDGTDPSFPGEYMRWEKKHKQKLAQEMKHSDN